MKRIFKSCVSAILMLSLVFGMYTVPAFAEETDNTSGTQSLENNGSALGSSTSAADVISYFNYMKEHEGAKAATKQVVLDGNNITSAEGLTVGVYDGVDKTVSLEEGDEVTWTFNAPEDALYAMTFYYHTMESNGRDMEIGFRIDGEYPYQSALQASLKRTWVDDGEIKVGVNGNETAPYQKEVYKWMTAQLKDNETYSSEIFLVYLTKGEHTYTLEAQRESIIIGSITLSGLEETPTQSEYMSAAGNASDYAGEPLVYQGELATEKSDSYLIPTYDRISPITQGVNSLENSPAKVLRNTIGKNSWNSPGEWLSYTVDVPEDGWYEIGMRFIQNTAIGMATCRNIYVDGVIPSKDFEGIDFHYDASWQSLTVSSKDGTPSKIYLTKGQHEIKFEVTLGKWSDVMQQVDQVNSDISDLYSQIIMITGTSPDKYNDYNLKDQIPGLVEDMQEMSDLMYSLAEQFDELYGDKASSAETLRTIAYQMASFAEDPNSIPNRLATFRDNILQISNWLMTNTSQPLEIDYFTLKAPGSEAPQEEGGFLKKLVFGVRKFIASFFEDYTSISAAADSEEAITVWINQGRDQAQVLNDLIESEFTEETGIPVNLSVVQLGIVEATLAGKGPDICINLARSQPVNLAWRNALVDISQFDTFDEVKSRFAENAFEPYTFEGGVYAVPYTQSFFMMFYRTDIFEELGISVPKTWDDIYELIPILQRKNMNIGIPYLSVTTQAVVDSGIGVKDIYTSLLYQMGGSLYTSDNRHTGLDSSEALEAFKMWTDLYTVYDFNRDYDLNTEFRTAQIPLAFASIDTYNTFAVAAPEIRGLWAWAPLPGVEQEDGTINNSTTAAGAASTMFANADNYENCWKFLEWFSRDDIQEKFVKNVVSVAGSGARIMTANTNAFKNLGWSNEEYAALEQQMSNRVEIPEVPGGYFVVRSLDNAFRNVVDNDKNAKESFEKQYKNIEEEMQRKWKEYDLGQKNK